MPPLVLSRFAFFSMAIGLPGWAFAAADTPETLADPEALRAAIPHLAEQTSWKEYATPEQVKLFEGPATKWPVVPVERYDLTGFDATILGSPLPPPGVHPRLMFSPQDVPAVAARLKGTKRGQQLLANTEAALNRTLWNPESDEGKVFEKLANGSLEGLKWPEGEAAAPAFKNEHFFEGWKKSLRDTQHAGYFPYLLASAAFDCLLRGDAERGRKVAAATAAYYRLREPLIDRLNTEYHDRGIAPKDSWRPMSAVVGADNLGWAYDCAHGWMTDSERADMQRVISKATAGKRSYGMAGPTPWRDTNWVGWDLTFFLTAMSIEGEPGYDPAIYEAAKETAQAYLDWGFSDQGVIFETNGKNGAGLHHALLSLHVLARHGDNFFGHPHLRRLTKAQVAMVTPAGGANVSNGTWGGNVAFFGDVASALKWYYPKDPAADWLLRQATPDLPSFDVSAYEKQLADTKKPLPQLWTAFPLAVPGVILTGADWTGAKRPDGTLREAWEREGLDVPETLVDPEHGLLSARSSDDKDALFLHFEARPNFRGVGHQHHDSGHFYLAALGEMWAIEAGPKNSFSPDHNTVLIDGIGHSDVGHAPRVQWTGSSATPEAVVATADLSNAYAYGWCSPMHGFWNAPERREGKWRLEPDTDDEIVAYYKGTQNFKTRLWAHHYFEQNWGPVMRIAARPVRKATRLAALVRGPVPYAVIADHRDLDGQEHTYDWLMQLPEGVRLAGIFPKTGVPSVLLTRAPATGAWGRDSGDSKLPPGTPALLVCLLDEEAKQDASLPANTVESRKLPIRIEQLAAMPTAGNKPTATRLVITKEAVDPAFKVLLIPVRIGRDAMPQITWSAETNTATVAWKDRKDVLTFSETKEGTPALAVSRDGRPVSAARDTAAAP